MALITCPRMWERNLRQGNNLPNCGAPVNTTNTPDPVPQPNTNYSVKNIVLPKTINQERTQN